MKIWTFYVKLRSFLFLLLYYHQQEQVKVAQLPWHGYIISLSHTHNTPLMHSVLSFSLITVNSIDFSHRNVFS